MRVGVPKEIKAKEFRVGLMPASVRELVHHGHEVLVETRAGAGVGFDDEAYRAAGAEVVDGAEAVFARAEMIVKVKEPQASEIARLRPRPDSLHLPTPGARPAADRRPGGLRRHGHRLRDRDRRQRPPAAAGADERGGRAHVGTGWRPLPGEGAERRRPAAGRRTRHPRRPRWWCWAGGVSGTNAARMAMGHGGACHRDRQVAPHPRPPGHALRRPAQHHLRHGRRHRAARARRRPGDRRGAGARRRRAQAGHPARWWRR